MADWLWYGRLSVLPLFLATVETVAGIPESSPAVWSTNSVSLSRSPDGRVEVRAPNERTAVVVNGVGLRVVSDGKSLSGTEEDGVSTVAELGWARDSTAFYITQSDGGLVGTWYTVVYDIRPSGVRSIDVTSAIRRRFRKHYKCTYPETPNVAALAWLTNPRRILLVAEVPPHSSCPEMGKVSGYVVAVPSGEIVREIGQAKLESEWRSYMGPRLRQK